MALVLAALASLGARTIAPASAETPPSALSPGGPAHAVPTPPPTPRPAPAAPHPFSLSIVSVTPSAPAAGQQVTINYVVRNLAPGTVFAHLSATVGGGYPQTAGGKPPADTAYLGNQQVPGSLVVTGGAAGADLIVLTLSSTPCGAAASANPACAPTTFAQATTMVSFVAPPTVRDRIAGTTYADIHHGDARDGEVLASGYEFVVHDPGCRSGLFSVGNSGDDTFFKKKDLPAGATLVAVDFSLYRVPPGLTTDYYAGGAGGAGSYGVKLVRDSGDALHVHWENACRGPYSTLPVVYSISFEVTMPAGTDLGEAATPATQQPYPPASVNYGQLGVLPGATNAAAALVPEPAGIVLTWDGENFSATYAPKQPGTLSAIYNEEPYPIVLIADSRIGAGCAPENGNVLLAAHQTTTPAQFAGLYGTGPVLTPKKITLCSLQSPANTKSAVLLTLTFLQS